MHTERIQQETGEDVAKMENVHGLRWEIVPRSAVTKAVLARYLAVVTKAADAAINERASDPEEEAARALAAGFGAAMVWHGRTLNDHGYEQGDFECKTSLGLLDEDGQETPQYHRMRAETAAKLGTERLIGE
jgi:hypothetical protein